MIQLFKDVNYDFISKRRWAYLLSAAFITLGLVSIGAKGGLRYGIDFSGGTLIQTRFEKAVPVDLIRSALDRIKLGESVWLIAVLICPVKEIPFRTPLPRFSRTRS